MFQRKEQSKSLGKNVMKQGFLSLYRLQSSKKMVIMTLIEPKKRMEGLREKFNKNLEKNKNQSEMKNTVRVVKLTRGNQ